FRVREAGDGAAGVALREEDPRAIAAVLLDMTMPQMTGEDALRELRRVRKDVPVILMSGFSEQDAAARFRGLGLAGFVQKPFESDALVAALRAALESREKKSRAGRASPTRRTQRRS